MEERLRKGVMGIVFYGDGSRHREGRVFAEPNLPYVGVKTRNRTYLIPTEDIDEIVVYEPIEPGTQVAFRSDLKFTSIDGFGTIVAFLPAESDAHKVLEGLGRVGKINGHRFSNQDRYIVEVSPPTEVMLVAMGKESSDSGSMQREPQFYLPRVLDVSVVE